MGSLRARVRLRICATTPPFELLIWDFEHMRRLIENIDALYTCDDRDRVLKGAWIVIEGAKIAALGEGQAPAGEFAERIDLTGSVAMPGLINAHHHFFQTLTRALPRAQRGQLLDWLAVLYPVWATMSP